MDATTKRPRPTPSTNANAMIAITTDKRPAAKAATKKTAKKPPATATTTPKTRAVAVRRPKLIWRTRDQENSRLYNLQLDVAGLQSELQGLREYRTMLMSRAMNRPDDADGSFMRTVREYFHVFRHGYTPDPQANTRPRMLALMPEEVTPDVFVHQVMDEHVCIGRFAGLAQMMKQWERYSSVFGPMTLSFLDAEILSSFRGRGEGHEQVLVTARAQYHLYISLRTIEIMFPHILRQQEIVTKVLGRRITGVGKFDFVFDVTNNRIVRYEFSLDLTASFIDLLGDPEMVAEILKDALISDEFFIGDLSEFHPDADAPISIVSISQPEEPQGTNNESNEEPLETPHAPEVQPWKMTISSILSPVDDDEDASEVRDGDVTMDESEPYAEQAPDDDIPAHGMYVRFHRD